MKAVSGPPGLPPFLMGLAQESLVRQSGCADSQGSRGQVPRWGVGGPALRPWPVSEGAEGGPRP